MVNDSAADGKVFDYVVIGAGVAGLYTAWRTAESMRSKRVALFDAARGPGGRVASVVVPHVPFVAELGAMRFLAHHTRLFRLTQELGLPVRPFGFDNTAFFYLRGRCLPGDTFAGGRVWSRRTALPYAVDRAEHLNPFDLITLAIRRALATVRFITPTDATKKLTHKLRKLEKDDEALAATTFSTEEWELIKTDAQWDGAALYDIGFWDLVHGQLSEEGYQLAYDGSGYESILSMWSAAEAIPWFLSDFSTTGYQTLVGGMQRLTDSIYERYERLENATSSFGYSLRALWKEKDLFRLQFVNELGEPLPEVRATTVVLALPQKSLVQLNLQGLKFTAKDDDRKAEAWFRMMLNGVTPKALLKLFLIYEEQWWDGPKGHRDLQSFRVITDQPLRQIYHFGPQDQQGELLNERRERFRMVLAYSDSRFADYWKQLNESSAQDGPFVRRGVWKGLNRNEKKQLEDLLDTYGASYEVVKRANVQLARVHGIPNVPDPCIALVRHWLDEPYFAGWHAWDMGVPSVAVAERLLKPFRDADVFICGEAFSANQGWIEGALETAEKVVHMIATRHVD